MTGWRLWRLLTGRYRPAPASCDADEARRRRREAEYELRRAQSRTGAVERTVAAFEQAASVDEFAGLIEEAFSRKGER